MLLHGVDRIEQRAVARARSAAAHVDRGHRRAVEHDRGDAGGELGVVGMADPDAVDIGEQVFHGAPSEQGPLGVRTRYRGADHNAERIAAASLASARRGGASSGMIHDVSIPAALIAGLVSFLSPCVLPLVPPYLIYLTGATIEHVATDETDAASKRAVMISAADVRARLFHRVRGARRQRQPGRRPDPGLVGRAVDRRRHRHHPDGPALPRPDPDRPLDARGPAADAEAGRAVGRLCDGAGLRVRLDALHRPDPRGDPVGRRGRGHGDQGRRPARGLFRRASAFRSCSRPS